MVVASELTSPTPALLEVTASVVAVEATVVVVVATAVMTATTVVVTATTAVVTEVVTKERLRLRLRHRQRWVDQKNNCVSSAQEFYNGIRPLQSGHSRD